MKFQVQKASRKRRKFRCALVGVSGSGKTYTALTIAKALAPGGKILVVDTENESASLYDYITDFDVICLDDTHIKNYIDVIKFGEEAGYEVVIIDSLSHAWSRKNGALELVDKARARSQSNNSFTAWREVTPLHNKLVDAMLHSKFHLIVTMRSQTEYVIEKNEKGQAVPRKVGMKPIQRDGLEYEFDIVADMDLDHNLIISKSRYSELANEVINCPGERLGEEILEWLERGEASTPREPATKKFQVVEKRRGEDGARGQKKETETPKQEESQVDPRDVAAGSASSTNSSYQSICWKHPESASPEVRELVDRMVPLLRNANPDITDEQIEYARMICCQRFDVDGLHEIHPDEIESLREFMRTDMTQRLRDENILPPARRRAN